MPSLQCVCALLYLSILTPNYLMVPTISEGQERQMGKSEVGDEVKKYENYATDFSAAEKGANGEEFEATDFLQSVSTVAAERLLGLDYSLTTYHSISCDRTKATKVLKEQIDYYSWQFKNEADRIAGMLTFLKVPATAQLGLKLKDDMRSTKDKLDKIAATLGTSP